MYVPLKAAVWSIDDGDMDDDDIELVDSDQLLGEEDLAKPDPASLRGCSLVTISRFLVTIL